MGRNKGMVYLPEGVYITSDTIHLDSYSTLRGAGPGKTILKHSGGYLRSMGVVADMTTKAYGTGDDQVTVKEVVRLNGEKARGLTRTRVAVRDRAQSEVFTTMEGNAPGARGHMGCTEVVRDAALASNTPLVVVRHDQAQVTHEAAIGTVNRKELEPLLARGLDEDEAVGLIIRGLIR